MKNYFLPENEIFKFTKYIDINYNFIRISSNFLKYYKNNLLFNFNEIIC